jgi:hypothetical protein
LLIEEELPPFGDGSELLAQWVRADLVVDRRITSRDAVSMTGYWRHDDHADDDEH